MMHYLHVQDKTRMRELHATEEPKKLFPTCFAHLHLIACKLWQSINPSLDFIRRKRLHPIKKNVLPINRPVLQVVGWQATQK